MDDREFQDAINRLREDHARFMTLIERMPSLTDEQKKKMAGMLARHAQDYEYLERNVEAKDTGKFSQRAWRAARQVTQDRHTEEVRQRQLGGWRFILLAFVVFGAILLFRWYLIGHI